MRAIVEEYEGERASDEVEVIAEDWVERNQ